MKAKIFVVSTCIPEPGAEPCQPAVFGTEAEAEAYADQMLRAEWEAHGEWNDDASSVLPYPDNWRDAQERLKDMYTDGSWGTWEITTHTVVIPDQELKAVA